MPATDEGVQENVMFSMEPVRAGERGCGSGTETMLLGRFDPEPRLGLAIWAEPTGATC